MRTLSALLLSMLLVVTVIQAKQVYLDTALASTICITDEVCWFMTPSLWINQSAPEPMDEVYIIGDGSNLYTFMYLNQSINLTSLTIQDDVEFKFTANAAVEVENITLLGYVHLYFQDNAQLIINRASYLGSGAEVLMEGGAYAQDGDSFILEDGASFDVARGYLGLHSSLARVSGTLKFANQTMFVCTSPGLYFVGQVLSFPITPTIYYANFINSTIEFNAGWRIGNYSYLSNSSVTIRSTLPVNNLSSITVDAQSTLFIQGVQNMGIAKHNITGTLNISNSYVELTDTPSFKAPLVIGGISTIATSVFVLRSVEVINGINGESPVITFRTDGFHLFGPTTLPNTYIYSTQSIYLVGSIFISGGVNAANDIVIENGDFVLDGSLVTTLVQFINSTANLYEQWFTTNTSLVSSQVTINSDLQWTIPSLTVDSLSIFTIRNVPTFNLVSPNITGALIVSTSNVVITQAPSSLSATLVIAGASSLTVDTIVIRSLRVTHGENGEGPNITINSNAFHLIGTFYIPEIYINTQSAYFYGNIFVVGVINAAQEMYVHDSNFSVAGDINIGYDSTGVIASNTSNLSLRNVVFTSFTLQIGFNGSLDIEYAELYTNLTMRQNSTIGHRDSEIVGYVYNGGIFSVHHNLSITGDYYQSEHGVLRTRVDLANHTAGFLDVDGKAVIDGTIQYQIDFAARDSEKMTLPVIQTTQGVTGTFKSSPVNVGSLTDRSAVIAYSPNDVYISFGKNPGKSSLWWVWLLVTIGVIGAIGLAVVIVRNVRKRNDYVPVRG